jgi:hypothetical protein
MNRIIILVMLLCTACARKSQSHSTYVPLAEAEAIYGRLIAAGNYPTPSQHGTGERIGLFQDVNGGIWGLPLALTNDGAVSVCAPATLQEEKFTDSLSPGFVIVAATNAPTGWRGGTGDLELLLRDKHGHTLWQTVHGAHLTKDCGLPKSSDVSRQLRYYRLTTTGR